MQDHNSSVTFEIVIEILIVYPLDLSREVFESTQSNDKPKYLQS